MRVNADARRGTAVVVRAGSVEVRTRSGSYTVRAGNYLLAQGDEEPEIARGSFSRDRFDLWASDRLETTYDAPQSTSSRYVDDEYAGDVQALDGYGDWDYNTTYSSYVWRPRVAIGWQPYSYGSWYYTPVGLTWWSSDPWGWYPYHYGNWFFDAGWNSWCWSPGYVYSPAWVYWGYTPGYFGWCPTGWYGGYSPWWDTYYKNIGWGRNCRGLRDQRPLRDAASRRPRLELHRSVQPRHARSARSHPGHARRGSAGRQHRHLLAPHRPLGSRRQRTRRPARSRAGGSRTDRADHVSE